MSFEAGLVVAFGVEGESAEQLAARGVDDADVEVIDEHEDLDTGAGAADTDVVLGVTRQSAWERFSED